MKKSASLFSDLLHTFIIPIFPYVVVFSTSLYNSADSDLGWHLKYGEYFFHFGKLLRENIYSTTMTSYHWVNHSWLTDIISYILFKPFGFFGLSIAGAFIIMLSFYFIAKASDLSFWEKSFLFPILLFMNEPLFAVSFRSQLFSILGVSILYFLLHSYDLQNKNILFFTFPLFMLWANLHGGFILGIGIFTIWALFHIFSLVLTKIPFHEIQKVIVHLSIISLGIFLSTLIHPFSIDIYQETIRHFGNSMQKYIIEWLPLPLFSVLWWQLIIWGIVLVASVVLIFKKKKFLEYFPYIPFIIFLYILSFWMRRYAWTMYIISIPLVKIIFETLTPKKEVLKVWIPIILFSFVYLYTLFIKNPPLSFQTMNWNRYCRESVLCSPNSAQFLLDHRIKGDIYTFYNWGGWIIYNYYPLLKPSIDGRMSFWQDSQGNNAFRDYFVLEQNLGEMDKSKYDIVWVPPSKPIYKQMKNLVSEMKWEEVYDDDYASIFVRVKK